MSAASSLETILASEIRPLLDGFIAGRRYGWLVGPESVRPLAAGVVGWSRTVDETPEAERPGPLYVFAETFAEESAITASIRARGFLARGFYGWLLPAVIASGGYGALSEPGAWRTAPTESPPHTRYGVLCAPRTGSAYLSALLAEAGLGHPVEHVRGPAIPALTAGGLPLEEFLRAVEACDNVDGVFGTKLVFQDFLQACGADFARARRQLKALRQRGYVFFQLHRDVAESALSTVIAQASGVWHVGAAQLPSAQAALASAAPDLDEARRLVVHRLAHDALMERAASVPAGHRFDYAQLVGAPDAVVETVLGALSRPRKREATALRRPARLGADNPAYGEWGRRLNQRLLDEGEALLPDVRRAAAEAGGLGARDLARWPEIEAGVRRLLEQAARGVAGGGPAGRTPSRYSAA